MIGRIFVLYELRWSWALYIGTPYHNWDSRLITDTFEFPLNQF